MLWFIFSSAFYGAITNDDKKLTARYNNGMCDHFVNYSCYGLLNFYCSYYAAEPK